MRDGFLFIARLVRLVIRLWFQQAPCPPVDLSTRWIVSRTAIIQFCHYLCLFIFWVMIARAG